MLELVKLEAIANPINLLAKHISHKEDPVEKRFNLIMVCDTLAKKKYVF
jgi:hypothetical protein